MTNDTVCYEVAATASDPAIVGIVSVVCNGCEASDGMQPLPIFATFTSAIVTAGSNDA